MSGAKFGTAHLSPDVLARLRAFYERHGTLQLVALVESAGGHVNCTAEGGWGGQR